jgi:hypothetical protein
MMFYPDDIPVGVEKMGNGTSPGTAPEAAAPDTYAGVKVYRVIGYEFEVDNVKFTLRRTRGETTIIKSGELMRGSGSPDRVLTVKDEHLPALVTALQGIMK